MLSCKIHGTNLTPLCISCFQLLTRKLKTDGDLLKRIKENVQRVEDTLYEHGLHGAQAASYTDGVRTYGEPVLEACMDAIDAAAGYDVRTDINKEQAAQARARRLVDRKHGDNRHIIDLLCDEIERLRKGVMRSEPVARPDGACTVAGDDASVKTRMPYLTMPSLGDPWRNPRFGRD